MKNTIEPVSNNLHITAPRASKRQAFSKEEFAARVANVQKDIVAAGLDVLLVHTPENICYLTGYETSGYFEYQVLAVPASGTPVLLVREVEKLNVDEYTWYPHAWLWENGEDYYAMTARLVASVGVSRGGRVGLEYHSYFVFAQVLKSLEEALKDYSLVDAGRIVERRRLVKSPAEQVYSRAAAKIADCSIAAAVEAAAAGKTELDVAAAAHFGHIMAGGEYPALPHYISTGPNCYLGHPSWSEKRLADGELMKLEVLGVKRRYHAGITRTVHIGKAPDKLRDSAARSFELQDVLLRELRPGVHMGELTRSVRERLTAQGHPVEKRRMGYAMGIGFPPTAGEAMTADFRESAQWILEPGMVFHMLYIITTEVAFSDTVLITENGYERLTQTPMKLIEV